MTYAFSSDEDGDLWLYSEDPASDAWVVEVKHERAAEFVVASREQIWLPAAGFQMSRNAWFVDRHSKVRVSTSAGEVITRQT